MAKSQGVPLAMLNGVLRAVPQGVWLSGVEMKPQEVKVRVEEPHDRGRDERDPRSPGGQAHRGRGAGAASRPVRLAPTREVLQLAGYSVVIKGSAFNNFQIADFMDNLRKVGIFADVDFVVTEAERIDQTRVVAFEVTATVKL